MANSRSKTRLTGTGTGTGWVGAALGAGKAGNGSEAPAMMSVVQNGVGDDGFGFGAHAQDGFEWG